MKIVIDLFDGVSASALRLHVDFAECITARELESQTLVNNQ